MPLTGFRQTAPDEANRVREFLAQVFGSGLDAPSLRAELIRWKYYDPRPDWHGSRSYVIERAGKYAAHGCVWPMRFGRTDACQIIDWAASPEAVGAGMLLRREVEKMVPVSVAIGGSEDSRKVLPRAGYRTVAQLRTFVRVLRPLRQFSRRTDRPVWRRGAKTARAWWWSLAPAPHIPERWSSEAVTRFRSEDLPAAAVRSPDLLNYLLACPAVRMHGYVLRKAGEIMGHLLVSAVDGQARIADLHLIGQNPSDWVAAVSLATRVAAEDETALELVAHSCLEPFSSALLAAGFRERGEQPVFVKGAGGTPADDFLHISPADYDDFFAIHPGQPFAA